MGRRLAAHAHADSSVLQCIKYGVEFIYHATFVTDRTIEALEKVKDKHVVTPAFGLRYNTQYESAPWGITEEVAERIGNKREFDTLPPPGDWTSQLRRGVLELCILKLLRHGPSYGYEIVTTLGDLGPLAAGENTVYPLLRRLKADRHLETFARESPAGPPRQVPTG